MHSALLTIPTLELLKLWGELVECYHGINGFGGDTCVLYAYRFHPSSPSIDKNPQFKDSEIGAEMHRERLAVGKAALIALLRLFMESHRCVAEFGTFKSIDAYEKDPVEFNWHAHVTIVRIGRAI